MSGTLLLAQFLLRAMFGLALGMALTSPRQVTGGYYRNHLYVLLGLGVLATLATWGSPEPAACWLALAAAIISYLGAAIWLYNKAGPGLLALWAVAAAALVGAELADPVGEQSLPEQIAHWLDAPTSGLVLGLTLAAMFLGHWYLNAPGMALAPLERLIRLMAAAVVLRGIVCAAGLAMRLELLGNPTVSEALFLLLRWLGLWGALSLAVMALKTLQIPNTQSATGILYVGVIATFLGELMSLLLSARLPLPV